MSQLKTKHKGKKKEAKVLPLPVIREDAAGIDIGATLIHVAVGPGRDEEPVRTFETFTRDLQAIAVWLRTVGVKTVAMRLRTQAWSLPEFIGSRCTSYWKAKGSKCCWSMRIT